jgi:predicted amidohydrolase
VVAGTIVESATGAKDEPRYNTCLYVSRKGKVLARYRKKNLWHPEKEFLTASEDDHLAFETEHFKCGLLIWLVSSAPLIAAHITTSWDMAWPEAFRELMQQGAEVIIIPTYWLATDITDVGMKHDPKFVCAASKCRLIMWTVGRRRRPSSIRLW